MYERHGNEQRKKQFQKIMKAIRRDPQDGLRRFYDAYAKLMQTTAQVVCRSTDKANEVVNDVLIKIWKQAQTVGEIENPEGWIYRITVNAAKDAVRERMPLSLNENVVAEEGRFQEVIDRDSFYWLIQDLSETEQAVMIHKFVLQYTFQEMSDAWQKPLTTVTSTYYRALEKIKKKIEEKS